MTIRVRDSGGVATIASAKVRDGSNVLQSLAQIYIRDEDGLHPLLAGLSASVSPNTASGFGYSSSSIPVITSSSTCFATGGSGPYTYLWEPDDVAWAAVSPTAATTVFRSPALAPGEVSSTTFICTVTDAASNTAESPVVSTFAENNYSPIP